MKYISIFVLPLTLAANIEYKQATIDDTPELLKLQSNISEVDQGKIVIMPKSFRQMVLEENIGDGKLFVAKEGKNIIACKKLYLMNEEDALSVCTEEIRCMGDQKQLIDSSEFYEGGNKGFLCRVNACSSNPQSIINDPCIYNGGDFTVEGYRKRGINKELTDFALQSIRGKITGRPRCLNMVYGLVKANAGNEPGGNGDRSNLIIQSFLPFARLLSDKSTENDCANYYRYRSHKPTFDPDSVVCRPEPSTKIDQDYGCLLQFKYRS